MDRSLTLSPFSVLCCCPVVLSLSRSLSMQHSRSFLPSSSNFSRLSLPLPPHCIIVTSQSQRRQQQHDGEDDFPPTFGPDCLGRLRDGGRTDGRAGGRTTQISLFAPADAADTAFVVVVGVVAVVLLVSNAASVPLDVTRPRLLLRRELELELLPSSPPLPFLRLWRSPRRRGASR